MASLPTPPTITSLPPRARISSSPSLPCSQSFLSVPKSRPPSGQPGRSFVIKGPPPETDTGFLVVIVPSHRASSFLEVSACTPEAPAIRTTAHPIRKANTTSMRCAWRTTTPSPSLHASLATNAPKHATQRSLAHPPLQGLFTGVRGRRILGSPHSCLYID